MTTSVQEPHGAAPAGPTRTVSGAGVYLVGSERVAVVPVEQAATMVGTAGFIEVQGRGIEPGRLDALTTFAARLRDALEAARCSAVRLDVEPQEEGIAAFLLTQARARAALADATRERHYCTTCGKSTITNPDYETMLADRRRHDALLRGTGAAVFSGGISAFVSTSLLFAFRKTPPDHSCRYCQALKTEPSIVVFCPQCKSLYDKAILKQCPTCHYDFVKGVDLSDVWRPRAETTVPAPAGEKLAEIQLDDEPTFIAFDHRGHMLTASQARSVQLWDVSSENGPPTCLWRAAAGGVLNVSKPVVAFSPDGAWVATGKPMSRSFRLLRAADGTDAGCIDWAIADGSGPYGLAFAPEGRAVAVSYDKIDVFELSVAGLGSRIARLKQGFWTDFHALAFSPDGDRLAAAAGRHLFLWHTSEWSQEAKISTPGSITALAWNPTDPNMIAMSLGPIVRLIEVPSGREARTFSFDADVTGLALSPDGTFIAAASQDRSARVLDIGTGAEVARISRPTPIMAVAFAPDGRLAVGDAAGTVQFWTPADERAGGVAPPT